MIPILETSAAIYAAAFVREYYDHAKEFGCASALHNVPNFHDEASAVVEAWQEFARRMNDAT